MAGPRRTGSDTFDLRVARRDGDAGMLEAMQAGLLESTTYGWQSSRRRRACTPRLRRGSRAPTAATALVSMLLRATVQRPAKEQRVDQEGDQGCHPLPPARQGSTRSSVLWASTRVRPPWTHVGEDSFLSSFFPASGQRSVGGHGRQEWRTCRACPFLGGGRGRNRTGSK